MSKTAKYSTEPVNVFWTGGWDSSFQLLNLLFIQNKVVQPIYILDENRRSLSKEIQTMILLKSMIVNHPEYRSGSLKDVRLYLKADYHPPEAIIRNSYQHIVAKQHLGSQYEWLASFCKITGMRDVALCTQKGGRIASLLQPYVEPYNPVHGFRLNEQYADRPEYILFNYFSFPLLEISKLDMVRISKEYRFNDIMSHTWFCFRPKRGKPCGICNPCLYAAEEGLGRRIPPMKVFFGKVHKMFVRPSKRVLKRLIA